MRRIRVAIADDEALARQRIRNLLDQDREVELVGEAENGEEAVRLLREGAPDLLFLDIRMPAMDGFGVLDALRRPAESEAGTAVPLVIFVTAFEGHALRAFEVHAFDYLLKPYDRSRFRDTLERAKRQIRMQQRWDTAGMMRGKSAVSETGASEAAGVHAHDSEGQPGNGAPAMIPIRSERRVRFLTPSEITWIEADDNISRVHTRSGVLEARESLTRLEQRLPRAAFRRVHRSAIVNLSQVREVQPWFGGDYVMILADGTRVTTGRTYREVVRELIR